MTDTPAVEPEMNEYQVRITVHGSKAVLKRVSNELFAGARAGRTKAGVTVTRWKPGEIEKVQGSLFQLAISFRRLAAPSVNIKRDIENALRTKSIVGDDTPPRLAAEPIIRQRI